MKKRNPFLKGLLKNIFFVVFIFISLWALLSLTDFKLGNDNVEESSIPKLVQYINSGEVTKVEVYKNNVVAHLKNESKLEIKKEPGITLTENLSYFDIDESKMQDVGFVYHEDTSEWLFPFLLMVVLPFILLIVFFWFFFKKSKGGITQTFDFTKPKAKMFSQNAQEKKVTFSDVAGLKEEKEELTEIVDFLKHPQKYLKMGAKIPKGVLLVGPAGCGKTLLARAIAGESNVPFFYVSGSSFIELFVGVGSSRVRNLFEAAKKQQPCLIFIDELDSIGKVRGLSMSGGNEEREQTLNQLLTEMDGFEKNDKIIILGATNRVDVLDPALLRPGRFDRKVVVNLPDIKEREEILAIHAKGKPLSSDVKLREVAERTPGFSGADLENVINEAAILTAKNGEESISQKNVLESIEKVLLGPEKKSRILAVEEKEIAAYHEAGHAIVASFVENSEPVRKISIISRGMAAGYTLQVPEKERKLRRRSDFVSDIAVLLGGYLSEKMIYGEVSSGASDDLRRASNLARKVVKELGMSSFGPIAFGERNTEVFLGYESPENKNYSEETAIKIDNEVKSIILEAEEKAKQILAKYKEILERVTKELIVKETLEREEYEKLLNA
ncbi:MAG TPA: ATP-dependent zinc metalloprotease FtsH [Candidatus Pacearchaeota archaeon]|nr:ATP-dependent zinc metalloprotease FtsH [Candidatus Pacearchaeota archaeon]